MGISGGIEQGPKEFSQDDLLLWGPLTETHGSTTPTIHLSLLDHAYCWGDLINATIRL